MAPRAFALRLEVRVELFLIGGTRFAGGYSIDLLLLLLLADGRPMNGSDGILRGNCWFWWSSF